MDCPARALETVLEICSASLYHSWGNVGARWRPSHETASQFIVYCMPSDSKGSSFRGVCGDLIVIIDACCDPRVATHRLSNVGKEKESI